MAPSFVRRPSDVTPAFLARVVTPRLPGFDAGRARANDTGWDSVAVDDGRWIVRFPRDARALRTLGREVRICARVPALPVETPRPRLRDGPWPFSFHRKIPGDHLLAPDYERLAPAERDGVAEGVVALFATLHEIPLAEARALGAGPLPPLPGPDRLRDVLPRLPRDLVPFAREAIERSPSLAVPAGDPVFGYFDAHGWNMAFDREARRLVGLFDFGDAAIGDVHGELAPLHMVSNDLVRRAARRYERTTGRSMDLARVDLCSTICELCDLQDPPPWLDAAAIARGCVERLTLLARSV